MKRNKTIFFALISILIILLLYWFISFIVIDMREYAKVRQGMAVAEENYKKLRNERGNYNSIKEARQIQVQYFDTLKVHIPQKEVAKGPNSYIETLGVIQRIADKNNVTIQVFRPILVDTFPEIKVEKKLIDYKIERYLLEMECNGNFLSLGKFFTELQNQDRFVNLLKFNIETEYGPTGGLLCEAILYTYVFSDIY